MKQDAQSTANRLGAPLGAWRTAAACIPNQNCVQVNRAAPDRVGIRDSKSAASPELWFDSLNWRAFLDHVPV